MDPTAPTEPAKQSATSTPLKGGYRVLVRVRPPNEREENDHEPIVVSAPSGTRLHVLRSYQDPLDLSFDRVFGQEAEQAEIFPAVSDVVSAVISGHNSTILAYGQTGSGKTHTMTGGLNDADSDPGERLLLHGEQRGVIPRTLEQLFSHTSTAPIDNASATWRIHVNFVEIYNERVYDLLTGPEECRTAKRNAALQDGASSQRRSSVSLGDKCLDIWEDRDGSVSVPGITVVEVDSLEQVLEVLRLGTASRIYGDNGVNATSSRSHAIFQVQLEKRLLQDGRLLQAAKLNLVDLAGSEKIQPVTHGAVSGVALQELTSINLSLSTLGQCIAALVARNRHVPCRDSKLTRLLQDSLRGESVTTMCICIAPTRATLEETLSSLQFADRAKRAVLQPTRKTVKGDSKAQVTQLMAQVQDLTAELSRERAERLRLENFLRDRSSQEATATNSTCSVLGSPSKASLNEQLLADASRLLADASKFESAGGDSSGDEAPCFGESRNSAKLGDTDAEKSSPTSTRRRRVWGSDEEGDPGSNIAKLISGSSVTTLWKADSESTLGGPNGCASSDANTSLVPGSDCGDTDLESKVSLSAIDSSTVDSIASIDSRLRMLTGMLTDQNEELKRKLDMLGTVVPGIQAIENSLKLPPMPPASDASDPEPELVTFPGASSAAAAMTKARGRAADAANETSEVRLASLQRLREASTDPNLPPQQLRQLIDDALTPPDTARHMLTDSDRDSVEYIGSRASQKAAAKREQRAPSPPPAPPRMTPLSLSGMQSTAAALKLSPQSSPGADSPAAASKLPSPRQPHADGSVRAGSPGVRTGSIRNRVNSTSAAAPSKIATPPRSKTPPPNSGGLHGNASVTSARRRTVGTTSLPGPPLRCEVARNKRSSSSQNSSAASTCSSAPAKMPESPRTRMSATFGSSGGAGAASANSASSGRGLAGSAANSQPLASTSTWMALPPPPTREEPECTAEPLGHSPRELRLKNASLRQELKDLDNAAAAGLSCLEDDDEDDASASCWGSLPAPGSEAHQMPSAAPSLGSMSPFSAFADAVAGGRPSFADASPARPKPGGEAPRTSSSALSAKLARGSPSTPSPAGRAAAAQPRSSTAASSRRASSTIGARGSRGPAGKPPPAPSAASEVESLSSTSLLICDQGSVGDSNLARSNSSTSIGSISMSSRRHAGSDVSSSGFGSIPSSIRMGPGSDVSGPGSYSGSHSSARRLSSGSYGSSGRASSTPGTGSTPAADRTSRTSKRRESALDIAARCWQEFEGALK